jgi:hypothetical protein
MKKTCRIQKLEMLVKKLNKNYLFFTPPAT